MKLRAIMSLVGFLASAGLLPAIASAAAAQQHSPQFEAGCKQMQLKKFNDAIGSMTEAIAVDARDSLAYFRRGQSFYCLGKYSDALQDFDKAISIDKDVSTFYLWRGTAQAKSGNDKAAVRDYLKAMRLDQSLVSAYNSAQSGKPMPSAANLSADDKARTKNGANKKNPDAVSLGYAENAVNDYAQAIKRASIKSTAYFRPGTVYSGICELADNGSKIGVKLSAQSDGTITERDGAEYFSLNGSTKELREIEQQISDQPANAKLYYERGRLLEQLGWSEMALSDFDRSVELDKENALYRLARAFLYHQTQKEELAAADVEQAISLEPDLPAAIMFHPPQKIIDAR